MFSQRCPNCGRVILSQIREDPSKGVMKIRILKVPLEGGNASIKCPQCKGFFEAPFLQFLQFVAT